MKEVVPSFEDLMELLGKSPERPDRPILVVSTPGDGNNWAAAHFLRDRAPLVVTAAPDWPAQRQDPVKVALANIASPAVAALVASFLAMSRKLAIQEHIRACIERNTEGAIRDAALARLAEQTVSPILTKEDFDEIIHSAAPRLDGRQSKSKSPAVRRRERGW